MPKFDRRSHGRVVQSTLGGSKAASVVGRFRTLARNGHRTSMRKPLMIRYRAYAVRFDGDFDGYESLNCVDDDDAIGKARLLADDSAIELWSGERFVTRLEHKSK
jgi:hypothetical protein